MMEAVLWVFVLAITPVIYADIEAIGYPAALEQLYNAFNNTNAEESIGESIASYCVTTYAFRNNVNVDPYVPSAADLDHIDKASRNNLRRRRRRAAFLPPGQYRIRKEYRMLSQEERDNYHWCMNALKNDAFIQHEWEWKSKYDVIVDYHRIATNAHGVEAFLAWHRVYLWTLENDLRALGGRCSDLTLPFWDATAEHYANILKRGSAKESIIFSNEYAGIGSGANFGSWGLSRSLADEGHLFGRDRIETLKIASLNENIALPFRTYSLEIYHNGIHNFVGGFLADLVFAPRDPIFFLLHCYIDYLWEEIRQYMLANGRDPSIYFTADRSVTMANFPSWTNEEGFSNLWYERHVRYQPSFSCQHDTCSNNPGLECKNITGENITPQGIQCVATSGQKTGSSGETTTPPPEDITTTTPAINDITTMSENNDVTTTLEITDVTTAPANSILPIPSTTLPWWWWIFRRRKRDVPTTSHGDHSSNDGKKVPQAQIHVCNSRTCPYAPTALQNTFTINGITDASLWAYIPLKVVYMRSRGLKFHSFASSYSREKHAPTKNSTMDIFDTRFNPTLEQRLYTGDGRPYESCRIDDSGSTKIHIRTDGINYHGTSMEYANVDGRFPLNSQKAFIPIKDPTINATEVCLMAYDTCGRLCLPTCRQKGSTPVFKPCTGCIRVTNSAPRNYGKYVADICGNEWNFVDVENTEFLDPEESDNDIFLKFVCDASSKFPWQRQQSGR